MTFLERVARVKAQGPLSDLIGRSVKLRRIGSSYSGLCPFHSERTPSFSVNDQLAKFRCFGCNRSGDAIDWLVLTERVTTSRALEMLEHDAHLCSPASGRIDAPFYGKHASSGFAEERAKRTDWARQLWKECQPIERSVVECYLRSRSIMVDPGPSLGFHPSLKHPSTGRRYAGMVAAVTDAAGSVSGIHRTFLSADGTSKADVVPAKMMAGECRRKCVRFGLPGATSGHILAIGEGIETSLSVRQATGLPVWAALSLSNMGSVPIPSDGTVREIILLADADEADRQAADAVRLQAVAAYRRAGFDVRIACPPDGCDFNDVLREATQ